MHLQDLKMPAVFFPHPEGSRLVSVRLCCITRAAGVGADDGKVRIASESAGICSLLGASIRS